LLNKTVSIIDYGMGNLWSVVSAIKFLGFDPVIITSSEEIINAKTIILPGVGSFRSAMESLNLNNRSEAIKEVVISGKAKILGICLGMQLLGAVGLEDGETLGLGLINEKVEKISFDCNSVYKLPHIGFNQIYFSNPGKLFEGIKTGSDFYFVHSYRMLPVESASIFSTTIYGENFMSAYESDNVFATQFHPEKSQTNGIKLLSNYLNA
jgi:glutamine amidotransferase